MMKVSARLLAMMFAPLLILAFSVGIGTVSADGPVWTANPNWDLPDVGKGSAPAFIDIDADGDYDLFSGEQFGISFAYENTGSETSPNWTAKPSWDLPDLEMGSKPAFADMDNDGDYDMLIGEGPTGATYGYENTGSASSPNWTAKPSWDLPTLEWMGAKPALADLDDDGDYDLLLYQAYTGDPFAYENEGSVSSPNWTRNSCWDPPFAGQGATSDFADIDADGDYDLLVGIKADGATYAYENTGSASSPNWTRKTSWDPPNVTQLAAKPALADLDDDGDYDLLIGTMDGVTLGYENTASDTGTDTDTTPPVISNVASTGITNNSATITWDTDDSSDSLVKYGTTSEVYTSEEYNVAKVTSHNISLTGLDAGTTYYYLISSTDPGGNAAESAEYSFTTLAMLDTTPPVISNVASAGITNNSATITWDTNESSDSLVKYGTISGVYTSEEYNATNVTSHNISLTGLDAGTIYFYLVNSTDTSGNAAESTEYRLTTLATPTITMKKTFEIINIEAGKTKSVTFERLDVRKVSIEVDKNVSDVNVTVEEVDKPEEITDAPGIAYGYINLTVTNLTDVNATTKIKFKVNKSWLAGHDIEEATIKLNRYDGHWTALSTYKIDEDIASVYFKAATPEFSLFAITGEKKVKAAVVAVTPTPTLAVRTTKTPAATPVPTSKVPGFEAIFATSSLLITYMYLFVFRKKEKKGDR